MVHGRQITIVRKKNTNSKHNLWGPDIVYAPCCIAAILLTQRFPVEKQIGLFLITPARASQEADSGALWGTRAGVDPMKKAEKPPTKVKSWAKLTPSEN